MKSNRCTRILTCCTRALWAFGLALGALGLGGAVLPAHAQGASATTANPTVRFNAPGVKQVSLTVCNDHGCDAVDQSVTVLDPKPSIFGLPSVPARIGAGQGLSLSAGTAGRPPLNARWVVSKTGVPSLFLPGSQVFWVTLDRGSYQLKLEVDNADGSAVSAPIPVDVVRMTFADVPPSLGIWQFVETMAANGVTSGCGGVPPLYCPNGIVSREQMAVFLLRAKEGSTYTPPVCLTQVFDDVPCTSPFAAWVNELAARGVTSGCGNGNYCPTAKTSRGQMAVFLLRAKEGPTYAPPACTIPSFGDVPCSDPLAPWINELAARGITGGCGSGNYCSGSTVNRGSMAVFLTATFELQAPSLF